MAKLEPLVSSHEESERQKANRILRISSGKRMLKNQKPSDPISDNQDSLIEDPTTSLTEAETKPKISDK